MIRTYIVQAKYDSEASVWVATSEDIPGLVTEADTMENLMKKLDCVIPDILEASGELEDASNVPFELVARASAIAHYRKVA